MEAIWVVLALVILTGVLTAIGIFRLGRFEATLEFPLFKWRFTGVQRNGDKQEDKDS